MVNVYRAGSLCPQQPEMIVSGGYDHKVAVWDARSVIMFGFEASTSCL